MENNMEQTVTSETREKGRNSFAALRNMFTPTKSSDHTTVENLPKPSKERSKNGNIAVPNFHQYDPKIPATHLKPRDEELISENETSSKEVTELLQSENKVPIKDVINETEQMDFTVKSPTARVPIEKALDDLHSLDADSNQTVSKTAMPEESSTDSDQAKNVSEDADTIIATTRHEEPENTIPTTQDEILQEHSNLQEFHAMEVPVTNGQTSDPKTEDDEAKAKMNLLQKKLVSSAVSLKEPHQPSGKSSQSSLYSCGPSSSSLCHLTELSQPKPEALRTTLMCLRQLHGKDAEHLGNIERHLRSLRRGTTTGRNRTSKSTRTQTKLPIPDDENALGERQALERFAANLFARLERKRALENFEVSKLQMPVEIGYYRAAYDALVTTFGQPYHKCTLELYQQLAGELGFEAEVFVIDKTPRIANEHV